MRRALAVGALSVLLAAATGCGSSPTADLPGAAPHPDPTLASPDVAPVPELPVTVTSADGSTVTVTDVSRIVPLQGDLAEVVFDLGLGEHVVGRDISATFEEASDLPLVTRAHDVSAESVLSLHPTLVLVDGDTGPPEAIEHIRRVGIPVLEIERPTRIEDIVPRIHAVATALGVPAAGEALAAETDERLADARGATPEGEPPSVAFLYLRGSAGVYLLGGPGSGVDSMIRAAGGVDAGTEMGLENPFTPITAEALVQAAPDVVLLTTTGLDSVGGVAGLTEIAGIAQTPAGRDGRVATLEDGLLFSFGARTPEAIEALADQFHRAEGG